MSMLEELWISGLDYQGRPVKKGSAMERKMVLYAKNTEKMKAMLSDQQTEQYEKNHRRLQRGGGPIRSGSLRAGLHPGHQAHDRRDALGRVAFHRRSVSVRNWFGVIKENGFKIYGTNCLKCIDKQTFGMLKYPHDIKTVGVLLCGGKMIPKRFRF